MIAVSGFFRRRGVSMRPMLVQVALRVGLMLSLVLAALGGALVATGLRPALHVAHAVAAVPTHPRPQPATPTPVPTPIAPARALLIADGPHATPDGAWIQSNRVTLRITLTTPLATTMLRAEAEVLAADVP